MSASILVRSSSANKNQSWTNDVHGVVLFEDLFNELSSGRVRFDKTVPKK